jgi:beta-glucosidase
VNAGFRVKRERITVLFLVLGLILSTSLIAEVGIDISQGRFLPYLDASLSAEDRAADLVSRMTTDEKVGQMTQVDQQYLTRHTDIATCFLGSLLSGGGSCPSPNTPLNWVRMVNNYQRFAVEDTRLGIPLLYGIDAVHGHNNVVGAVMFPQNIGMGSTWDPVLVQESAHVTAAEVRATGIAWTFSPCIDVVRDDRWGRVYESFGEDPYLVKWMGASAIQGYQGTDLTAADAIAACAKHFMGSGGTLNGIDRGNCVASMRIVREVHLEPFVGAVQAGTQSIMASFCSINGDKMTGNEYLLTDVLKTEQGFGNILVSDWGAVDFVNILNYSAAVKQSINAGIDMVMVPGYPRGYLTFQQVLKSLISDGSVPMSRIDDAVYRILVVKFRLGLFEHPYVDESLSSTVGSEAHREVARQAVQESMVLLKNDGILPLSKSIGTIYVAGPNANDIGNQCGGWTITWQGSGGNITQGTTILQAIRNTVSPETTVVFNEEADNITHPYDAGIVVVGERPYAEYPGDVNSLDLPSPQMDIIRRVVDSGTPTIVIMVAGRPRTGIETELSKWNAFMMAWLPGTEGQGVADVLFGDVDATGRLSVSWPRTTAQEPINYDHRPDENYDPLFKFGYGLSYTNFTYSDLNVTPSSLAPGGVVNVDVNVTNTGTRSGRDVVQVYVNDVESILSTPVWKLYRAEKTPTLAASASMTLNFSIPVSELGFCTNSQYKVLENGTFNVMLGGLSREIVVAGISGDIDGNGVVNILDVVIVARAFGSKPGDSGWNSLADLDRNQVVDIADIALVAGNFGNTV